MSTNRALESAIEYHHQFKYGTTEYKAVGGLIDALIEDGTFSHSQAWEDLRAAERAGAEQ